MSQVSMERWAAVDWGDQSHQVCIGQADGSVIDSFACPHTAEGLADLVARLQEHGPLAGVGVETTHGLLVEKLLEAGLTVFPINPKLSAAWREGFTVAGSKSDTIDAHVIFDGLRQHHSRLRAFHPDDPKTRELAMLCRDEAQFIQQRTALVHQLKACLKQYHPMAVEWFSDWTSPTAWDFVLAFPTPEILIGASAKKLVGFLKTHHIGLSPLWKERVEQHTQPASWPSDPATVAAKNLLAVGLAKQLRTLQAILVQFRTRIEQLYEQHPDSSVFSSLPGNGPKLGPRMLSSFGSDRERYASADPLQALSGTVPVTKQSGKKCYIVFRRACQPFFRNTMTQYAWHSVRKSLWAKAFYSTAVAGGQTHYQALRNLAAKWISIIFRMWQDRKPYDEQTYIASLIRHRSPLVAHLLPLMQGASF